MNHNKKKKDKYFSKEDLDRLDSVMEIQYTIDVNKRTEKKKYPKFTK